MKIGLFALEIGRQVGGLEVYETNLIRALARVDARNEYRVFCTDPCVPEILDLQANNFSFEALPRNRVRSVLWDAPRALAKARLDLFHALFVPPPFTSVPYVFTHHGSEVMERPDFYPLLLGARIRFLYRRAFARAALILCVSDYVRNYLIDHQRISTARVQTIYPGCRQEFLTVDKSAARDFVKRKYGLNKPYLLTVGRIEPRKNPIRVLEAYDRFRHSVMNPPQLVFAGMKTWSAAEFDRTISKLGLQGWVVELGYVPDDDLPSLYSAAEFAIYASLWEGFGFPVLEAFSTGTPLLTSRTTSLPEVSGGACLLVDPHSVEEIAQGMVSLYSNQSLRADMIQKGFARVTAFSWDRTALQTSKAYEVVAAGFKAGQLFQSKV